MKVFASTANDDIELIAAHDFASVDRSEVWDLEVSTNISGVLHERPLSLAVEALLGKCLRMYYVQTNNRKCIVAAHSYLEAANLLMDEGYYTRQNIKVYPYEIKGKAEILLIL